jgi:hypothetical protein
MPPFELRNPNMERQIFKGVCLLLGRPVLRLYSAL